METLKNDNTDTDTDMDTDTETAITMIMMALLLTLILTTLMIVGFVKEWVENSQNKLFKVADIPHT